MALAVKHNSGHKQPGPFHISEGPNADEDEDEDGPPSHIVKTIDAGACEQASEEVKLMLLPSANISLRSSTKVNSNAPSLAAVTSALAANSSEHALQQ